MQKNKNVCIYCIGQLIFPSKIYVLFIGTFFEKTGSQLQSTCIENGVMVRYGSKVKHDTDAFHVFHLLQLIKI